MQLATLNMPTSLVTKLYEHLPKSEMTMRPENMKVFLKIVSA